MCSKLCKLGKNITFVYKFIIFVSWLVVHLTLEQAVLQVQVMARDTVLCSWARHFTLTVSLSTQAYKWVLVNLMLGGNRVMD